MGHHGSRSGVLFPVSSGSYHGGGSGGRGKATYGGCGMRFSRRDNQVRTRWLAAARRGVSSDLRFMVGQPLHYGGPGGKAGLGEGARRARRWSCHPKGHVHRRRPARHAPDTLERHGKRRARQAKGRLRYHWHTTPVPARSDRICLKKASTSPILRDSLPLCPLTRRYPMTHPSPPPRRLAASLV